MANKRYKLTIEVESKDGRIIALDRQAVTEAISEIFPMNNGYKIDWQYVGEKEAE